MDFFTSMDVSSSGMAAERTRMNLISSNIANANSTRTQEGGPYKRKDPVFSAVPATGSFNSVTGPGRRRGSEKGGGCSNPGRSVSPADAVRSDPSGRRRAGIRGASQCQCHRRDGGHDIRHQGIRGKCYGSPGRQEHGDENTRSFTVIRNIRDASP